MSSLYSAVMKQKIDDVRRIIEENPNSVNEVKTADNKRTPIFAAVYYASRFVPGLNEDILDLLIDSGADVKKTDEYGYNVLHLIPLEFRGNSITESKVNSVISKLINAGADVIQNDDEGFIPLHKAIYENNVYVVKALLRNSSLELRKQQLDIRSGIDGDSALDIAEDGGQQLIVDILMRALDDILNGINYTNNNTVLNTSFNNTTDLTDLNRQSHDNHNRQNVNNETSGENNSQSSQVSMISRVSERDVYKEIQNMQNNSRYPINITKNILFNDPIMLSEERINIAEYIAEDQDNIVLKYGEEKYFFTNRSTIDKMYEDDSSTFYGCYNADTAIMPRDGNVSRRKKYLSLKSIGLIGPNNYCIMNLLLDNTIQQIFYIKNLDYTFESYASQAVLNGRDVVSALHCQAGHKSAISTIVAAYPSIKDDISNDKSNNSTIATENSQNNNSQPGYISVWRDNRPPVSSDNNRSSSSSGGKAKRTTKKKMTKKVKITVRKIKKRSKKNDNKKKVKK